MKLFYPVILAAALGFFPSSDAALRSPRSRAAAASTNTNADDEPKVVDFEALIAAHEDFNANNVVADQSNRHLGCWGDNTPVAKWHPTYIAGWANGYCRKTVDCDSPGYSTELACCRAAYAGQVSGYCLLQLPNPPTVSPTDDGAGGLDVYYPDYNQEWAEGQCVNTRPMPSGRPTYLTMLACCKAAYRGQMSGKCLSMLPSRPTTTPTNSDYEVDFWYPRYEENWAESGCSNKLPLPYGNVNDRPNYSTQIACCRGAYRGQTSGSCLAELPNPPTSSPIPLKGGNVWYPDYNTPFAKATCLNALPFPFTNGGRPTYDSKADCCRGAYAGQVSNVCICSLENPPVGCPTKAVRYILFELSLDR
ncbi:hypothetical protein ACHAXR_010990 [Thalassiosira sp. AJA248-18]